MSRTRRRARPGRALLWSVPLAAAAAVVFTCSDAAVTLQAAAAATSPLTASYQAGVQWPTGYAGRYTIVNTGTSAVTGWTLVFTLPAGTSLVKAWNAIAAESGGTVTMTGKGHDATVAAGAMVTVGFTTTSAGSPGQPADCRINGAPCVGRGSSPAPSASAVTTSPPATAPAPAPIVSPARGSVGVPSAGAAGFAPYVETSLDTPFSLVSTAEAIGVLQYNLAFVVAGGNGCTPEWGGVMAVGAYPVAAQIGALRAVGGDVRISFGGEAGSELAVTCTSLPALEAAYQRVISAYNVNKIDFDVEGAALGDTAANSRRDQALAALQKQDPGLQVSFTLPVLPTGLTAGGTALIRDAVSAGVRISAVNIMTMDYGDGAAPHPAGMMGTYAIDAATATDAQLATALTISTDAAWSRIAVTPLIGVNDLSDEIFTLADAQQLTAFAASKGLAWLSMWSAGRDTECPGGPQPTTQINCSSIAQAPDAFDNALGAYSAPARR